MQEYVSFSHSTVQFLLYICVYVYVYQIMRALKGDTEDVELEALGESRWNVLAIKSKNHRAKENLAE